jgi:hypothetical protein
VETKSKVKKGGMFDARNLPREQCVDFFFAKHKLALIVDPRFLRYSDFQTLRNCPEKILCILEEDVYYENDGEEHRFWCDANVKTYPVHPQDSHIKVSREGDHCLCHSPLPLTLALHLLEKPTKYRKASIDLEWQHYLQFDALTEGTPYFPRFQDGIFLSVQTLSGSPT